MSPRSRSTEVVIVGGGIAGASLAYWLAERGHRRAILLEREEQPGRHASGRSAAAQSELHFDPLIHQLLVEGGRFLRNPPAGFAGVPILEPTGVFELFGEEDLADLERQAPEMAARGTRLELIDAGEARRRIPRLSGGGFAGGAWLPTSGRLRVEALLAGYLERARGGGLEVWTGTEVRGALLRGGRCAGVETSAGTIEADLVVNAAGAWAEPVAKLAGALPIPFFPRRRTIVTFPAPEGVDPRGWPLVCDNSAGGVYFAPEGEGLLACPMDADLVEPCDARPDPDVVEETLRRLRGLAPSLAPKRPGGSRAGLRTFTPDRRFVLGEDPERPGFFWLAGQGGWGIETSPAIGRIAADLITRGASDWPGAGDLKPARFGARPA